MKRQRVAAARSAVCLLAILVSPVRGALAQSQGFFGQQQGEWNSAPPLVLPPWSSEAARNGQLATSNNQTGGSGLDVVLHLADCEPATGGPNGLSCAKEGYFITGFEKEGQWVVGGGLVPLARATCCRILPPEDFRDPSGQELSPESVVSIGCHLASGQSSADLRCNSKGSSFATGFQNDARVNPTVEAYYPLGPLSCCTPAILLANGDLWSTRRCQCEETSHTTCSSGDTKEHLLVGFKTYREARSREHVPITPMGCCKTCLGSQIVDDTCSDLDNCNLHGQCVFGACECHQGWGGQDCSEQQSSNDKRVTSWQLAVLVVGALGIAVSVLVLAGHVYTACITPLDTDNEGEEMSHALLLRLDADDAGSVGSEDTTGDMLDSDVIEQHDDEDVEMPSVDGEARQTEAHDGSQSGRSAAEMVPFDVDESSMHNQTTDGHSHCHSDDDGVPEDDGYGDCNICFSRPIQVVVVPCGHACMCRRCSRRVARCPICRQDVARRQRLFMGK